MLAVGAKHILLINRQLTKRHMGEQLAAGNADNGVEDKEDPLRDEAHEVKVEKVNRIERTTGLLGKVERLRLSLEGQVCHYKGDTGVVAGRTGSIQQEQEERLVTGGRTNDRSSYVRGSQVSSSPTKPKKTD